MEGKLPEKKLLNIYAKSEGDIFFMAELMGQNIQDFIKYVKHYPNLWRKIIDDMSGYIVPDYHVEKYFRIPFEVENIWTSPDDLDDLLYTDYSVNLLLPNINKLTEKEREDLIAAIYYDCYDLGVDVIFNNKKYNRRDRRITASVHSINGNPLSKEKIKKILDTEDFIDNETIEKLMNKMGMMNESKNNEFNPNKFDIDKINKYLSRIKSKFNEFISDVEFLGVGEEQGHPVFEISFYVDYYAMYSRNDVQNADIAEVFDDTLNKVNTIIQMVENPHDKGVWYQIIYDVYSKTRPDDMPMRLKKSYFLA